MTIKFPRPLAVGDTIAISAISSGVSVNDYPRLDYAIDRLKADGFRVIEGQYVRSQYKNASANKHLRAQELMAFLLDPDVSAILPPWGGELAIEILELIDFEKLRNIPPKWLVGFSDISTVHLPLTLISKWATLHSPNLMQFSTPEIDETTVYMWNILTGRQHALFEQYSSKAFQIEEYDWHKTPLKGPNLTGKTSWKRLDTNDEPIHFKGRLIGGCLETISRLAGTGYGNLPQFCEQYEQDGVILYFEYSELQPCELLRTLTSLKMHGWFKRLTGILVGRAVANLDNDPSKLNDLDALQAVLADLDIPILYDVDLGHVPPQMSFLNGALTQISFYDQGGKMSFSVK